MLYVVVDEYEGNDEDGSAPVQYFIRTFCGTQSRITLDFYSELDADVNEYDWQSVPSSDDSMSGESLFTDSQGDEAALPVPPAVAAKDQTDSAAENPDENIIDPEAAIADPADANAAPDSNDVIDLPAQPDVQPAADANAQ